MYLLVVLQQDFSTLACKEEGIRNANTNSEKLIESCRGIEIDEIDDRIRLY